MKWQSKLDPKSQSQFLSSCFGRTFYFQINHKKQGITHSLMFIHETSQLLIQHRKRRLLNVCMGWRLGESESEDPALSPICRMHFHIGGLKNMLRVSGYQPLEGRIGES